VNRYLDVASLPRWARFAVPAAIWLTGALVVAEAVLCLPQLRGEAGAALAGELVHDAVYAVSAVLVTVRVALVPRHRLAWSLLALGLTVYGAADVGYFAVIQHLDPEPFPSLADAGWLAFYPLTYVFLALLLRARVRRWHASTYLDGLISACGLGALAVSLVLGPVLTAGQGSVAATTVALAYPVGDLLLVVLLGAALAVLGWRTGRQWWLIAGGVAWFVLGDVVFLLESASPEGYATGTWVDVTWLAGVAMMAAAAWFPDQRRTSGRMDGWALLAVPMVFACTSLALLISGSLRAEPSGRLVTVLAGLTIALALGRTALTFREVRNLGEAKTQARTDELTGLANRRRFLEELAQLEGRAGDVGGSSAFALLLLDLDRFKEVNDSFGHPAGDHLLQQVGPRLTAVLADRGFVARIGGDEFAMVLPAADRETASRVARQVHSALREPFTLEGMPLHVGGSIGIALAPEHGRSPAVLLQRADLAMYLAKRGNLGHAVYRPGEADDARHRLQTVEELRVALDEDQLVVHYQPKIDVRTGRVIGAEALVRWEHPERGLLFPDAFLPLAEQAGLMHRVALQVLERSLREVRAWRAAGHHLHVAVNLSVSNLQDAGLPDQVEMLLEALGVPADALVLEITENILMADAELSQQVLAGLRAIGVRLAVDDYGTGYSSLAYLRELPVDELKLDRGFVQNLRVDARAAAIVRSTVQLSHELGMVMVAEGVEDAAALDDLRRWGCDLAQGYHIARPAGGDAFARWLDQRAPVATRTSATVAR
jgi:diguanylate cyclase (GGDEF)-like protein